MLKNTIYCIYGAGGCGRSLMPILKEQLSDNSKILFIDTDKIILMFIKKVPKRLILLIH